MNDLTLPEATGKSLFQQGQNEIENGLDDVHT
jgi:hypothetical protein